MSATSPFINLKPMKDELALQGTALIRDAIEYWAVDYNDTFPPNGLQSTVRTYWPTDLAWPKNPYANFFMSDSGSLGDYTYSLTGMGDGFSLTAHLSSGDMTLGQSDWSKHFSRMREHFKDFMAQAYAQVLKDYVDEWKLTNGGALPTAGEMAPDGGVGTAHAWWPRNPWTNAPMVAGDFRGVVYVPNDDGTFALGVHESPDQTPAIPPDTYPETNWAK